MNIEEYNEIKKEEKLEERLIKLEKYISDILLDFEKRVVVEILNKLREQTEKQPLKNRALLSEVEKVKIKIAYVDKKINDFNIEEMQEKVDMMRSELLVKGVEQYVKINVDNLCDKINELEKIIKEHEEGLMLHKSIIAELNSRNSNDKKPHKCPVCDGIKFTLGGCEGFQYSNCVICDGKGIVWG